MIALLLRAVSICKSMFKIASMAHLILFLSIALSQFKRKRKSSSLDSQNQDTNKFQIWTPQRQTQRTARTPATRTTASCEIESQTCRRLPRCQRSQARFGVDTKARLVSSSPPPSKLKSKLIAKFRSMKTKASRKHPKEYKQARARYPSPEY